MDSYLFKISKKLVNKEVGTKRHGQEVGVKM